MIRIRYADLPKAADVAREDFLLRKHGRPHRHSTTVGSKSKAIRLATGKFLDSRSLGLVDEKMDRPPVPVVPAFVVDPSIRSRHRQYIPLAARVR